MHSPGGQNGDPLRIRQKCALSYLVPSTLGCTLRPLPFTAPTQQKL
jgi:hypothetical protein